MSEDQPSSWGREARKERREAKRQTDKAAIQENQHKGPNWDRALAWIAIAMGVILVLAAPKIGRIATVVLLVAIWVCLLHPAWQLVSHRRSQRERVLRFSGLMLLVSVIVFAFGDWVWPPIKRHKLSTRESARFEEQLRQWIGEKPSLVVIGCPIRDEPTCSYAEQFIGLFHDAGWPVQKTIDRVTLDHADVGVVFHVHSWGPNDDPSSNFRHDAIGEYPKAVIAIYKAFSQLEIVPEGHSMENIPRHQVEIYFGPEKDNPKEPTDLANKLKELGY